MQGWEWREHEGKEEERWKREVDCLAEAKTEKGGSKVGILLPDIHRLSLNERGKMLNNSGKF